VRYLALLRGLNVGGNNIVKMADLRACLERAGLNSVTTYIQSGNVLFQSHLKNAARLAGSIEQTLSKEFAYTAVVVVVSQEQLERIVNEAPPGFGSNPAKYRYDVVFIKPPFSAPEVLPTISLKQGVDAALESNGVLYLERLISRAAESKLSKLITNAAYKSMTIRNWNTVGKLRQLMNAA
jgi:uncharacterized protein (DUF1697 family)